MRIRPIAAVLAAGAVTGALIGLAPIASAAPTGTTTTDTGSAVVVQSPGNAQVTAQPGDAALQAGEIQTPFFLGYGGLVFHHGGGHR
jgi:hypothetical protein